MKLLLLLLLLVGFSAWAQPTSVATAPGNTPEPQVSFARESKPHAYYVRQAELWWQQVQRDLHSETSWYNYYRACRNAQGTADWKEEFVQESPALRLGADIVPLLQQHIPGTFTYYFVAGSTGGVASDGELLLKAYQLNPDFEGIHATLVTYATTTGNDTLRRAVNQRWYTRQELSPGLLSYAYNVLHSLAPGAILLTEHDNDTYPLWLLQDVLHVRPDVHVLNIDFLLDESFRTRTFTKLHLEPLPLGEIHVNEYARNWEKVVHHLVTGYRLTRPLYLAMSMAPARYEGLTADLYPTGLAWRYSKTKIATQALNRQLLEEQFLWDEVRQPLAYDRSAHFVQQLNRNYLPLLRECYHVYQRTKQSQRQQQVQQLVEAILAGTESAAEREHARQAFFSAVPVHSLQR